MHSPNMSFSAQGIHSVNLNIALINRIEEITLSAIRKAHTNIDCWLHVLSQSSYYMVVFLTKNVTLEKLMNYFPTKLLPCYRLEVKV